MRNVVFALIALALLLGASFAMMGNGKQAGQDSADAAQGEGNGQPVVSPRMTARERYEVSKQEYTESMKQWNERSGLGKDAVVSRGKTYTSNAVSVLQKMLGVVGEHVEKSRGLTQEQKDQYMERVREHTMTVAQLSDSVEGVATGKQLIEQARLVKQEWNQARHQAKLILGGVGVNKMEQATELGWKAVNSTGALIARCREAGFDTSSADEHLGQFKEQLMFAEQENNQANEMFGSGNDTGGYIHLRNAHSYIVEAKNSVSELKKDLKDCVLKRGVVLRGEGWLSASGSGRAEITGNGTVKAEFTADSANGKVTVIDRAGDASVSIEGGKEVASPQNASELKSVVTHVYTGATSIMVSGSRFTVILNGNGIELYAEGRGIAILRGTGTYEAGSVGNSTALSTGIWSASGAAVNIASSTE